MFYAKITNTGVDIEGSSSKFRDWAKRNVGVRVSIEPILPESLNQRKFFEGAVIPLITYYQEGMDSHNPVDRAKVREWLKIEFNGEMAVVGGKAIKVASSTRGRLNKGMLERIMDWGADQGYQMELLSPKDFLHWRETVFPFGGPTTYIDYLLEIGKMKRK